MRSLAVNRTILPGSLDNDHTVLRSLLYGLVPPREGLATGAQAQKIPRAHNILGAR
jgi:hypothetical protein